MNWHLLVVDVQEAFADHITGWREILERMAVMIRCAVKLGIPITATEQYPQRLGATVPPVKAELPEMPIFSKTVFSCMRVPEIRERLCAAGPVHLLVVGIETHVCVLQTALDALRMTTPTVRPYVLVDAVSSRYPVDRETALARMAREGAVLSTVESAVLEIVGDAGTQRFKDILGEIKDRP